MSRCWTMFNASGTRSSNGFCAVYPSGHLFVLEAFIAHEFVIGTSGVAILPRRSAIAAPRSGRASSLAQTLRKGRWANQSRPGLLAFRSGEKAPITEGRRTRSPHKGTMWTSTIDLGSTGRREIRRRFARQNTCATRPQQPGESAISSRPNCSRAPAAGACVSLWRVSMVRARNMNLITSPVKLEARFTRLIRRHDTPLWATAWAGVASKPFRTSRRPSQDCVVSLSSDFCANPSWIFVQAFLHRKGVRFIKNPQGTFRLRLLLLS